jgi:hypothetical protein
MNKQKFLQLLRNRKVLAGGVVLASALVVGILTFRGGNEELDFPTYIDPLTEASIEAEETPLGATPTTTKSTTSQTSTDTKVVKLKKAPKKTYTKKLKTKVVTKAPTTEVQGNTTIKTQIREEISTKESYKKKKKTKKVTTTTVTYITTITTVMPEATNMSASASAEAANTSEGVSSGSESDSSGGESGSSGKRELSEADLQSFAYLLPGNVINAFNRLGFKVTIDPSYGATGNCNTREQSITLQRYDESGTVYHEMGHFVDFVSGYRSDKANSPFVGIYNEEASKFIGANKSYASSKPAEFFAEAFREYILRTSNGTLGDLKAACPKTVEAIETALGKITDQQVNMIKKAYSSVWGA